VSAWFEGPACFKTSAPPADPGESGCRESGRKVSVGEVLVCEEPGCEEFVPTKPAAADEVD
jgi:hypothetical protein